MRFVQKIAVALLVIGLALGASAGCAEGEKPLSAQEKVYVQPTERTDRTARTVRTEKTARTAPTVKTVKTAPTGKTVQVGSSGRARLGNRSEKQTIFTWTAKPTTFI